MPDIIVATKADEYQRLLSFPCIFPSLKKPEASDALRHLITFGLLLKNSGKEKAPRISAKIMPRM